MLTNQVMREVFLLGTSIGVFLISCSCSGLEDRKRSGLRYPNVNPVPVTITPALTVASLPDALSMPMSRMRQPRTTSGRLIPVASRAEQARPTKELTQKAIASNPNGKDD